MKEISLEVRAFVIDSDNQVLLINKNGLWQMPSAPAEPGEKLSATIIKAVKKETGINIEIAGLMFLYEDASLNHMLIPFYLAKPSLKKSSLKPGQNKDSKFIGLDNFKFNIFEGLDRPTTEAIKKFFELQSVIKNK